MPAIHRQSDTNTAGASVVGIVQSSVYANGKLVSVNGSAVDSHGKRAHRSPFTANGSSSVFVEGIAVNRQGDSDTCGHPRDSGSSDVFVDS